MTTADHYRTTDFVALHQGERRPITAKAPRGTVDRCPGCSGPRTESNWSNSPRMGLRFCSIACAIKKKAELRDASGGAA